VSLVHACHIPDAARPVRLLVLGRARQAVQDLAVRHGLDPEACEVKAGKPEDIIPAMERRESADLLVMGAVSRSIEAHPVIGNTAERVIDRVLCDLLVIKPAGFRVPSLVPASRQPADDRNTPRIRTKRATAHAG
jgi:nucleotide-binding universal stress UspA family protein